MKNDTTDSISEDENKDIIHLWEPLKFSIDKNYKYVPNGKLFSICSNILYYGIAFPILKIVTKVVYDLKIEGKENIKEIKSGAISISNHVLILDCAMVGLACGMKRIYYTTREGSFKIPFVRKLIKLLRAIPIPSSIGNKKNFINEIATILKTGKIVHFYPEMALWPYCDKIRNFKNGPFKLAIDNNVPIIPMVFKFREPKGIRKLFKHKKDVTLVVLEPIITNNCDKSKQGVEILREKVRQKLMDLDNKIL